MLLNNQQQTRLNDLRQKIYKCIELHIQDGAAPKSYDGKLTITMIYPSYSFRTEPVQYCIILDSYLICPDGRGREWYGNTVEEVLFCAERDINQWTDEIKHEFEDGNAVHKEIGNECFINNVCNVACGNHRCGCKQDGKCNGNLRPQ